MEKIEFYAACADILGTEHEDSKFDSPRYSHRFDTMLSTSRNRWSFRDPGNGRFPGYGVIRIFSPTCIHVALTEPVKHVGTFESMEAVLAFLRGVKNGQT